MRTTLFFSLLLLSSSVFLYAQESTKAINGRVHSPIRDISGVHVKNISSGKGAVTDDNGNFSIKVALLDTLLFSAVQFRRKTMVITSSVLKSKMIFVALEEFTNELDEVVLRPFDLSGDISEDIDKMKIGPIVTETTLNLPNADVTPPTQNERKLYTARTWEFKGTSLKLDPIINYFSGRTKMLKRRVARDTYYLELENLYRGIPDSLFIQGLFIPKDHIYNFLFFCETDQQFTQLTATQDKYGIWNFLRRKSSAYRKNNALD